MKKRNIMLIAGVLLIINLVGCSAKNIDIPKTANESEIANYYLQMAIDKDNSAYQESARSSVASAYYLKLIYEEQQKQTKLLQEIVNK